MKPERVEEYRRLLRNVDKGRLGRVCTSHRAMLDNAEEWGLAMMLPSREHGHQWRLTDGGMDFAYPPSHKESFRLTK